MLRQKLNNVLELVIVFLTGGFAYGIIEDVSRGWTHISMGLLGGAAMLLIHALNRGEKTLPNMFLNATLSAVFITLCEFITGEILNVQMGLNIWDYSELPMNLDGQICVSFSLIWFGLSGIGAMLDDLMREKMFIAKSAVMPYIGISGTEESAIL